MRSIILLIALILIANTYHEANKVKSENKVKEQKLSNIWK